MSKNITEQILNLQHENERLQALDKLFEKAIKNEFGYGKKRIHSLLKKDNQMQAEFSNEICKYFKLTDNVMMQEFLTIMCSENSLNYFNNKRANNTVPASMQG